VKAIYRTAWELPMRTLIDMAAARGAYIDQSQSLNLFQESPTIGRLSSMYMYAWEKGLKTTYYLRSRPATSINKVTVAGSESAVTTALEEAGEATQATATAGAAKFDDATAIACSLENPEACEACQ
jgi:ribonucleoside-diphosphate reductase alpha chain